MSPSNLSESSDVELLDIVRSDHANAERAFAVLIDRHSRKLIATAWGVLRDMDLAKDAVQNTLVRVYENRKELKKEGSIAAYMHRAVYNEARTCARGERRELIRRESAAQNDLLPFSASNDTAKSLEENERAKSVHAAITNLPGRAGEIFRLWWAGNHSYVEIADLMGISVKGVEQARARAIQELREALKDHS